MPEPPTTPTVAALAVRWVDALNRRDLEALTGLLAPDAVWDAVGVGDERFVGRTAIRAFLEEWLRPYEDFQTDIEEALDFGSGVLLNVATSRGRLAGGTGSIQIRIGYVGVLDGEEIARITSYLDIDEARAAAERLAEERG